MKVLTDKLGQCREQTENESHRGSRHTDTHDLPSNQEDQGGQQEAGLMSGDGTHALASFRRV